MEHIYLETIKRLIKENWWITLVVLAAVIGGPYFHSVTDVPEGDSTIKHFLAMVFCAALLGAIIGGIIWVIKEVIIHTLIWWDHEVEKTKKIWEDKLEDL